MPDHLVSFEVSPLSGNRFLIRSTFRAGDTIRFSLPIWIPGSYMRRDFARHLTIRNIISDGATAVWRLVSPSQWEAVGRAGRWIVEYEIYAREYSVRGCYLDDIRAMFNPCCACICIEGLENAPQQVNWSPDSLRSEWQVFGSPSKNQRSFEFSDYQHLIDTPLMMGNNLITSRFYTGGVPHEIIISGAIRDFDLERLTKDVTTVTQEAVNMYGRLPDIPAYSFLLFLTENSYGGLEHQSSTMLMESRCALPQKGETSTAYIRLLGLFSHEYFHTWNVKSMRPTEYRAGYTLHTEQPSEMLWLFEGFTAYFDNLLLMRSGVINEEQYFKLISTDISYHLQRLGRHRQSLAHSSFEAWTKLYNGGENAINISTNYYGHGSLAALCIDAYLREHSSDTFSLGMLMPVLWQDEIVIQNGLDEARFIHIAQAHLPREQAEPFAEFIRKLIHDTDFLPLEWAAKILGLELTLLPAINADDTGSEAPANARATSEPGFRWRMTNGKTYLRALNPKSAAARAGLATDDELLTLNGERITTDNLWQGLCKQSPNSIVLLSILRDGIQTEYQFPLAQAEKNTCILRANKNADSTTQARRRQWLNQAS